MITYSFVIPHHNTPELLNRCLDSIPQREDIEIIVADDNSDDDKKPGISRPDVKIIYIDAEHTKGAGRARNYALKKAVGKWIVFADADDFFVDGFLDVLDGYKDSSYDVVYHSAQAAHTDTLKSMPLLLSKHNGLFQEFDGSKQAIDAIKFKLHSPWWKMVSNAFITRYSIQFEEVPKGNDIFFSYQVGFFARSVAVEKQKLYTYTFNPRGITNGKKNSFIYLSSLEQRMKIDSFYHFIEHPEWISIRWKFWPKVIKKSGLASFFKTFILFLIRYRDMRSRRMQYVENIQNRII